MVTFNYGLILDGLLFKGVKFNSISFLFWGHIFWTLGYDTIYGFQDIKDDEIIGLKSTSRYRTLKDFIKIIQKIFKKYCCLVFFHLLAASTSSVAYLLDPAIKQLFIEQKQSLNLRYTCANCSSFCTERTSLYTSKSYNDSGIRRSKKRYTD